MKKLFALALVLILALSGMSALATEADMVGSWELTQAGMADMVFSAADLGLEMIIVLNADGTATLEMTTEGETETDDATWSMSGNVITVTDSLDQPEEFTYENGRLVLTEAESGLYMYLDKDGVLPADAAPSMDLSALMAEAETEVVTEEVVDEPVVETAQPATAEDFIGTWELEGAYTSDIRLTAAELGMEMTIVLNADSTALLSATAGEETEVDNNASWAMNETGALLTDATGDSIQLYLEDGLLVMDDGAGTKIYLQSSDAPAEEAIDASALTTYVNTEHGYTVSYPVTWYPVTQDNIEQLLEAMTTSNIEGIDQESLSASAAQVQTNGMHMVYLPDFSTNFNIIASPLGMNADAATLESILPSLVAQLEATFGTINRADVEPIVSFGDNEYVQLVYSYNLMGTDVYCIQYMISFNNNMYVITLSYSVNADGTTTLDNYIADMEAVLASFGSAN